MAQFEIAVLVLTYNALAKDVLNTLKSILSQKGVRFKIVLCDDGSKNNNENDIRDFFANNNFADFTTVFNPVNGGTIKNTLSGLDYADAPIVKLLSPKDFLHDEFSLKRIVDAYNDYKPTAIAGRAVFYSSGLEKIEIINSTNPHVIYKSSKLLDNHELKKQIIKYKDWFPGSVVAYETNTFRNNLLELVEANVRLSEDLAVELIALKGGNMYFINDNLVFYEFGSGVSTDTNSNQFSTVNRETERFFIDYLPNMYRNDRMVRKSKDLISTLCTKNRLKRKAKLLLFHKYYLFYYQVMHNSVNKLDKEYELLLLNRFIGGQ